MSWWWICLLQTYIFFTSQDVHWWTGIVWITSGILMFFISCLDSFWRHPFTAEDSLEEICQIADVCQFMYIKSGDTCLFFCDFTKMKAIDWSICLSVLLCTRTLCCCLQPLITASTSFHQNILNNTFQLWTATHFMHTNKMKTLFDNCRCRIDHFQDLMGKEAYYYVNCLHYSQCTSTFIVTWMCDPSSIN